MLRDVLESWTREKSVAEVVAILDAHSVPAAPIWDVEQAVSSAQTAFRQLLTDGQHPVAGTVRMMEQPDDHFLDIQRASHVIVIRGAGLSGLCQISHFPFQFKRLEIGC